MWVSWLHIGVDGCVSERMCYKAVRMVCVNVHLCGGQISLYDFIFEGGGVY